MKKSVTILGLLLIFSIKSFPQLTISPAENTELCPNVEYTFTVSGTASAPNFTVYSGTGLPLVISGFTSPTLPFTFKARFRDVNLRQGFEVKYTPSGSSEITKPFVFNRIKSLAIFTATSCAISTPVMAGGSVFPPCQAITRNISFPNIQYNTVSPTECFSSITTYEYLLPSGWKLGSTVSNGSIWLPGGSNVNVTSDLLTGDGNNIAVRPINTSCGGNTMIVDNGYTRYIPISRPAIAFPSIVGPDQICTSATYNLPNLPVGAIVTWSTTGSLAISGSVNANPVTVTNTTQSYGTLNAFITISCESRTVPKNISSVNPPNSSFTTSVKPILSGGSVLSCTAARQVGASYQWKRNGVIVSRTPTCSINGGCSPTGTTTYSVQLIVTNFCGVWSVSCKYYDYNCSYGFTEIAGDCDLLLLRTAGGSFAYFPNPANNELIVSYLKDDESQTSINESKTKEFEIELYSNEGKKVKTAKNNTDEKDINIDTQNLPNGTYFLHILDGKETIKKQIIIQH